MVWNSLCGGEQLGFWFETDLRPIDRRFEARIILRLDAFFAEFWRFKRGGILDGASSNPIPIGRM